MRVRKGAYHIAIPVYNLEMWIIVEDNFSDAVKRLRRVTPTFEVAVSDDGDKYDGMLMWSGARCYAMFLSTSALRKAPHDTIAHEMFHFTLRALTCLGEKLSAEFDEQAAHLCGWVTSKIYETLK